MSSSRCSGETDLPSGSPAGDESPEGRVKLFELRVFKRKWQRVQELTLYRVAWVEETSGTRQRVLQRLVGA